MSARVLWVSNETPDRFGQGGQRRQFFQISALVERGHSVHVLSLHGPQDDSSIARLARVERFRPVLRGRRNPLRASLPARRATSGRFDRLVVSHGESWELVRREVAQLTLPVLVDLHNVYSWWYERRGDAARAAQYRDLEREVIDGADALSVLSTTEQDKLRAVHGERGAETLVVRSGFDPAEWPERADRHPSPAVGLFGTWNWDPNRDGLAWFLTEVWPRVLQLRPDARCLISGSGVDPDLTGRPGVEVVGRVPSVGAFLATVTVAAVPVVGGVGAPVKFAEALASGCAVIATRDGAAGTDTPAFVRDDADDWVRWLLDRLAEQAPPQPSPGRAYALQHLTWTATTEPLASWLGAPVRSRRA